MGSLFSFTSNAQEAKAEMHEAIARALERMGLQAESFAKSKCPVDTGNLRNSITHQIQDEDVYIGTNVKYAKYIEFGTGVLAETGGRRTPWVFKSEKDGKFYQTDGAKAQPFIRPAVTEHTKEYQAIIKDELG